VRVVAEFVVTLAILSIISYLFVRRNRERDGNAPLRNEIEARVSFRAPLNRASVLGIGGFEGTRHAGVLVEPCRSLATGGEPPLLLDVA
jgi:hypothetical protein